MIVASIIVAGGIIFGALMIANNNSQAGGIGIGNVDSGTAGQNVSVVDGKQIIEIDARGGYSPRRSTAKAGLPTILRFKTSGTFDCSSSIRIPSLNISKILPQTGTTDVEVGSQNIGKLQGSCGMGMYPFEIDFES